MDVVLHPVNDRFMSRVVFPALELCAWNAQEGLTRLFDSLDDDILKLRIEQLLDRGVEGALLGQENELWHSAVERLLFQEWQEGAAGWVVKGQEVAFAGSLDQALHTGLMLEDADYPYAHGKTAKLVRHEFLALPERNLGIASLLCGAWKDLPKFQPDLVIRTQGRGKYAPQDGVAVSDWGFRSASVVVTWSLGLPSKLEGLLRREEKRLAPLELPEAAELLDYWNGKQPHPPPLAVAYSGLGPEASGWVREVGDLARAVRSAAQTGRGLVSLVTRSQDSQT